MRVLITGASGFTGQALCAALQQQQHGVHGIGLQPSAPFSWPMHQADLRDAAAVDQVFAQVQPDAVVHLAARSFVHDADLVGFYDHNVVATTRVLDAARAHQVQRVVLASSANVYGVPASDAALDENAPLAPVSHYGASKLAMEAIARTYNDDFALTITRPFNYTGINQGAHFLVPKLVSHFAQKQPSIELGNLDVARDYTALDDVVQAYMALLNSDAAAGQTVNICSNNRYALTDLLQLLTELSGHQLTVHSQPQFKRAHDIAVLRGNYDLLHRLTGWQPQFAMSTLLQSMLQAAQG